MNVTAIHPPDRIRIVVHGDVNAAREAVAKWVGFHRPLRDVVVDEHGVHCTVWVEDWDLFRRWTEATSDPRKPGDLVAY